MNIVGRTSDLELGMVFRGNFEFDEGVQMLIKVRADTISMMLP